MKKIVTIAAMMLAAVAVYAQDDLNRQVSVAKDYAPTVGRASKLSIEPVLSDTTRLHPEFDYTVRPRAWVTGFGVEPIRPAKVEAGRFMPQYPFYLKAGGGYPGQSVLDLYANTTGKGGNSLGFRLNHSGQYSEIKNVLGDKFDSRSTWNSAALYGKVAIGRLSLSGEIGWDYDILSYYGSTLQLTENAPGVSEYTSIGGDPLMQHYSTPHASIAFGHDFTDLSYFNFRLGAGGYILSDRHDRGELGGNVFLELGKTFGEHKLTLKASADMWKGRKSNDGLQGSIFLVSPRYEYANGNFLFRMGADFAYDAPKDTGATIGDYLDPGTGSGLNTESTLMWYLSDATEIEDDTYLFFYASAPYEHKKTLWFLPQAEVRVALAGGSFTPYATLRSGIENNGLRNLAGRNPYIHSMLHMVNSLPAMVDYQLRGGVSGTVAGVFSYDVHAGYDISRNVPLFFHSVLSPAGFTYVLEDKLRSFVLGARLEGRIADMVTLFASGRYNIYKERKEIRTNVSSGETISENTITYDFLPEYHASFGVKYNYGEKFYLEAGVDLRGKYSWSYYTPAEIPSFGTAESTAPHYSPASVNVRLKADYFISPRFGIFLEGENLANRKLYPYAYYRGMGINVSAGVKVRF